MKEFGCLFVSVVDDEDNEVEDWVDEHVEILLGLFFTEKAEVLDEVFEKLL